MKIKKGDKVKILIGKDSGKLGKVEHVDTKQLKVFVSGANLYKRHVRARQGMEGGIISIPKPLDISNVALVCPSCNKSARVGYSMLEGTKVRLCRKCKKEIK